MRGCCCCSSLSGLVLYPSRKYLGGYLTRRDVLALALHPVSTFSFVLQTSNQPSTSAMAQIQATATSPTKFETIFTAALEAYKKQTKKDITTHLLATLARLV